MPALRTAEDAIIIKWMSVALDGVDIAHRGDGHLEAPASCSQLHKWPDELRSALILINAGQPFY